MTLSKRYIALRPDGNGVRGRAEVFDGDALHRAQTFATDAATLPGRVLAVDLDSLAPASASEVEEHERPFIYHAEALARLGAPTPIVDELARLRAENERMRAVVEAADAWSRGSINGGTTADLERAIDNYRADYSPRPQMAVGPLGLTDICDEDIEWHAWPRAQGGQQVGVSAGVIAIHRPTGAAAACNEMRSQLRNKQTALTRLRVLIPALDRGERSRVALAIGEDAALAELRARVLDDSDSLSGFLGNRNISTPDLVSAIDKLRAMRGQR